MCKFPNFLCFVISSVSHSGQVPYSFTFHYIFSVPLCASSLSFYLSLFPLCTIMCKFSFLPFIICSVSHYVQVLHLFTFHYIFSVPFWASSLSIYIPLDLQCPILGKFPTFVTFHYIFNGLITSKYPIITFNYIFCMSLCASSLSIYTSLYLQCPILGKFPIYLHSIRSSVSHFGQVPYLFTFHYIFSVPFWASSLSIYIPLDLQCPIICMFPIFLPFIISLVSHSGQVPHSFTFHYFFSVPLCACSLSFYISLYIQCPIVCEYPIILCFIICSVSHYVQVLHLFTIHYIFSVPFWASTLQLYVSLFLQCPIMCMFPIFLHFIIYLVSHYVQVPYHFMFHYIFSVPLCASTLLLLHFIIFLMVSLLASTQSLRLIISFACHYVQVPYLFTFHYIFSVPFWASSLSIYVSLFLQCPIMCKFTIFLRFIIYLVSHYVQVPYHFMFHYIFSVPLCASSLLLLHFIIFLMVSLLASTLSLRLIISFAYHYVQVPYLFTFHQIFSVPLCACSISFYLSLYLQCPIMCKFPTFVTFHYIFNGLNTSKYPMITFNYIFRMSLCASSLSIYISLDLQCPIMCKFSIFFHFIISVVSHFGQVPYLFTFHQIFSVPFWASSLSIYISLYLQCPISGKFPIYLHSIGSSVSHYVHVPYLFTFHYIFSFPLCASSLTSYVSLYLQCPILGKYPIVLCFIISSVSHYLQVLHIFTFHSIFSVPFCASSLTSFVSLYLQCPILGKYPIILCFIIYLVSHYVQVPYLFTFHYFLCVPLCASSPSFYLSLYVQCPIMCKFSLFTFHYIFSYIPYYIFSVPLCASSLSIYISLYLQFPIMCKFPIFYISLYLQCPILGKYPILLRFIISSVSHYVQVLHIFTFHSIFSVPFCASNFLCFVISSVSHCGQVPNNFVSLYIQCPIMCKFPIYLHFIRSSVSHYVQVLHFFPFHYIFSVPFWASSLSIYIP